jgi:hypothetical protein
VGLELAELGECRVADLRIEDDGLFGGTFEAGSPVSLPGVEDRVLEAVNDQHADSA